MHLYKITRTDRHDYDEYDEIVVRAEDPEKALEMVKGCAYDGDDWHTCTEHGYYCQQFRGFRADGSNAIVERICEDGEPGLIIGSFNAG